MSIDEVGFLSPQIENFTVRFRQRYAQEFSLSEDINRTALQMMLRANVRSDSENESAELAIAMMFTRAISNFEGGMLLCEKGLVAEARTLTRACFESSACVCAIAAKGQDFVDALIANEIDGKKKFANWMLNRPDVTRYAEADAIPNFRKYLTEIAEEKAGQLNWEQVAATGGIGETYVFYRMLSMDAAHAGLGALERYFDVQVTNNQRKMLWGPLAGADEIGDTLLHLCCFLLTACAAYNAKACENYFGDQMQAHLDQYKVVIGGAPGRQS